MFRGLAARLNFLSLDCPDLQFGSKPRARNMAKPKVGSWSSLKKIAGYILNRERVVWIHDLQDEPKFSHLATDIDWGGNSTDRKSTSGAVRMIGGHFGKT